MKTEETVLELKHPLTKDIRMYCFVCTGNTCRSPMAAALLNDLGQSRGIFAFSRGTAVTPGAPIAENAAAALRAAGVEPAGRNDYTRHRAAQLTREDFEMCDGVFALTPAHAQQILFAFPEYAGRVRILGDIADPYGGTLEQYAACLEEIRGALRALFPYLVDGDAKS